MIIILIIGIHIIFIKLNHNISVVVFVVVLNDGGGGCRTHVRKYFQKTFSECRR